MNNKKTLKERLKEKDTSLIMAAKSDFWTFCMCMNEEFFSKRPYLYAIAEAYQNVFNDYCSQKASVAVVNMPPRAGKSFITSHFCTFWLGHFPDKPVMRNTCTAELCKKLSNSTRSLMELPQYKIIFEGVEVDYKSRGWKSWKIKGSTRATSYFGAGVSGNIIGEGAALAITDDLYPSMDVALSNAQNEFVLNWLNLSHHSRKEPFCAEIHIGTRWTKRDALGETLRFGCDYFVKIAAILNEGTDYESSFCEAAMPLEQLRKERDRLGGIDSMGWRAEYMQEPIERFGLLLPLDELQFTDVVPKYVFSCVMIDPANRGGDFFCAIEVVVGIDRKFYVNKVLYNKRGIEANAIELGRWSEMGNIDICRCESNGIGLAAILMIKNMLPPSMNFSGYNNNIPKEIRINMGYEFIKKNFIFRRVSRDKDEQYRLFLTEISTYSNIDKSFNPHDDGIDCLSSQAMLFKMLLQSKRMQVINEKISTFALNEKNE